MQTKIISLRISPDLDRQLRIEAAKCDLDRSAFIRKTLVEKMKELMGIQKYSAKGELQSNGELCHDN